MILVRRHLDGTFVGVITQPHSDKGVWVFAEPIGEAELVAKFAELGSHAIDTYDVIHEAKQSGFGYLSGFRNTA